MNVIQPHGAKPDSHSGCNVRSTVQLARIMIVPIPMFYGKRSWKVRDCKEIKNISPEGDRPVRYGYSSAAPNKALHAATTMVVVQPRVSGVQYNADAAFDFDELCEDVDVGEEADDGDVAVDGAAVMEKESVTLSTAQNCRARFSAEGTFVLQLPATQEYNALGNIGFGQ